MAFKDGSFAQLTLLPIRIFYNKERKIVGYKKPLKIIPGKISQKLSVFQLLIWKPLKFTARFEVGRMGEGR